MGQIFWLLIKELGCVIIISKNYDRISLDGNLLRVSAGCLLSKASKFSFENSLTGMEEVSGIPGSLGGAVAMNAGAYGVEMKDIIKSVRLVSKTGEILEVSNEDMDFSYRHSKVFDDDLVVSEAIFELKKMIKKKSMKNMRILQIEGLQNNLLIKNLQVLLSKDL
ncbi:MAG: FAD-binding protein [Anaerococcus obesiensis]